MPTQPELEELVERALKRELAARRGLRPHAQLGIAPNAPPAAVEQAYARLRARYDPGAFANYGEAVVGAAGQILEQLRSAYESMVQPVRTDGEPALPPLAPKERGDETCRALRTLRGAIERRVAEARAHREAGRRQDAIRVLESVLVLDRKHVVAQQELHELRAEATPKKPTTFSRLFGRVFGRRAAVVARSAGG